MKHQNSGALKAQRVKSITEDTFLSQIIGKRGLATMLGWRSLHIRPARVLDESAQDGYSWRTPVSGDGRDFPDLLLARPPRLILAELKRDGQDPRPGQAEWLDCFFGCESVEAYLWYPSDFEEIKQILTLGHVPSRVERLGLKSTWWPKEILVKVEEL